MNDDVPDPDCVEYAPGGYWITLLLTLAVLVGLTLFVALCWWMARAGEA